MACTVSRRLIESMSNMASAQRKEKKELILAHEIGENEPKLVVLACCVGFCHGYSGRIDGFSSKHFSGRPLSPVS